MNGMAKENNIIAKTILAEIFNMPIEEVKDDASIENRFEYQINEFKRCVIKLNLLLSGLRLSRV